MKQVFTFLAGVTIILSSCSSARKATQTPDDVYYSPGTPAAGYASSSSNNHDEYYSTGTSDQYVRLKTQDPARWSYFDDYNAYDSYYSPMSAGGYYGYPSYGLGYSSLSFGLGLYNPYFGWNNYFAWNTCYNPYFYNPYYGGAVIVVGGTKGGYSAPVYNHVRAFNPASYRNAGFASGNNTNNRLYRPVTTTSNSYNTGRTSSFLSRFTNGSNSSNNNGSYRPANNSSSSMSQPSRSYTPSSSSSGGGGGNSGGGGGGGGVSRPGRH